LSGFHNRVCLDSGLASGIGATTQRAASGGIAVTSTSL
jgi:hypothetical protein